MIKFSRAFLCTLSGVFPQTKISKPTRREKISLFCGKGTHN
jgi:hypothetical protein